MTNLRFDPRCQVFLRVADALVDHFAGIDFLDISPLMDELEVIGAQLPASTDAHVRAHLEQRIKQIGRKLNEIATVTAKIHAELLAEAEPTGPKGH
ncbi:hypothetical protein ACQ858_13610 [Variovorax ureilyticus]|uniref:hypothetical protein n=1 Tax=Variovorax ureilyticus TaxID=1836198 RepID=UPI003D6701BE